MSICYVVATPIGNIEDWSPRAIKILQSVSVIFAEDTRHSAHLMQLFNIRTQMKSLHEHNERDRIELIMSLLSDNNDVAIISDAGTPLISDPGFPVVRALRENNYNVVPIPGVSAVITALSVSGIATDRFLFEGFLPNKRSARLSALNVLKHETRTLIFYESSHRILEMLEDCIDVFSSDRYAFIGREMTKRYEQYQSDRLCQLLAHYQQNEDQVRGEFVVVISGAEAEAFGEEQTLILSDLLKELLSELSLKQAVSIAVKLTKLPKNQVYQMALELQEASH